MRSDMSAATLVRIDATAIAGSSLDLPSLEAFAEAHGLEDARQLETLRWLEGLAAQSPKAGDSDAAWLNPTLAGHLAAADIFTLAQLVERINGVGRRWCAGIKAMGQGKALRIMEWLRQHLDSIKLQLGRHVAMPRSKLYAHELQAVVAPATAIRRAHCGCRPRAMRPRSSSSSRTGTPAGTSWCSQCGGPRHCPPPSAKACAPRWLRSGSTTA